MATSGSTNYTETRDEIIKDALIEINILGAEDTVESADQALAARHLNRMIKAWQADGINMWRHQEATLFLTKGTESYTLSSTGAHASNTVVETTLSAAEVAAQTILSITSTAGMTAADVVLIELDDDTYEDTTIVSVDSATQITVTDALTSGAASGNRVYSYTTKISAPLAIDDARLRNNDDNDRVLEKTHRENYMSIPDKDSESSPNQFFYDRQLNNGTLFIYPVSDSLKNRIKFTYARSIEDFDAAGDNPDFPVEWLDALVLGLAARLARAFGRDQKLIGSLRQEADIALAKVKSWDTSRAPISIVPETRY